MKKSIQVAVALVLTALLLYFVVDAHEVGQVLARADPRWALLTILVITGDRALMSFKWGLLLRARGHRLPFAHGLMIYCSAMVWGLALPSTVGADAIRAALVRRRGVEYNDSVATILVERGVGFVSALGMGLLSLATLRFLLPETANYELLLVAGAFAMLVAMFVLMLSFTRRALDIFLGLLPVRWQHGRIVERLQQLHVTYCALAENRRTLLQFTLLTLAQQMLLLGVTWLIAKSLAIEVNPLYLFAAAPLAFLASRLPISFDGIGIYEGVFVAVMTLAGLSPAESFALALCGRIFNLITWLPWFFVFFLSGGFARPVLQGVEEPTPKSG